MSEDNQELISSLQSQVRHLQTRVKELEVDNEMLQSRLSNCVCEKIEEKLDGSVLDTASSVEKKGKIDTGGFKTRKKKVTEKMPGIGNRHSKRYVALKVMYFGQRYMTDRNMLTASENTSIDWAGFTDQISIFMPFRKLCRLQTYRKFYGFASEAQMEPTVESEIFNALEKTRLLVADKKESQYSRCGRTDKGVSSVGQVIALYLRSKLKENSTDCKTSGETVQQTGEIDYVRVLNRALPKDIRIIGWCPVPVDFSARFSCLSREYKYFFWSENLNLLVCNGECRKEICRGT
ncbi:hypothetical protein Pint_07846 [Pistacia integerrima]|uniref:Uncharacterized protein n=1 Tax=Pistacia integerrima TaxID=434235 RepID=A0ACC0XWH4_9ROSI|nr:hypothetical protein Pint_07846 [Pistacia integerrima]